MAMGPDGAKTKNDCAGQTSNKLLTCSGESDDSRTVVRTVRPICCLRRRSRLKHLRGLGMNKNIAMGPDRGQNQKQGSALRLWKQCTQLFESLDLIRSKMKLIRPMSMTPRKS
jgi:hypothetical protein